jgi:hypothetical protein
VSEVFVRPFGALRLYELQLPTGPGGPSAVGASLRLLELAPSAISFPLLAATFRAIFGDADFSLHLAGETGAFKSELAALHQQHFGASVDRLHLPGSSPPDRTLFHFDDNSASFGIPKYQISPQLGTIGCA